MTTVVVAVRHDGGPATSASGTANSAAVARTTDPHLSPIRNDPAAAFDCMGAQTSDAANAQVATIGITSNLFCVSPLPHSHQVAASDLRSSGPLRSWVVTEALLAGTVAASVDGVAWIPAGSTAPAGSPAPAGTAPGSGTGPHITAPAGTAPGQAVDLYLLGSLRGLAFPIDGGGTLVLYSGRTVVLRQPIPSPAVGGRIAAASSPAPGHAPAPAAGAATGAVAGNTAPAARSYPPGEGPSPKPGAWPTNARGQTYGSAGGANAQTGEPDLIAAWATNGKEGYVLRTDLESPLPTSPSQAAIYHPASRTIPVYESDGVTQIGVFVVSGS